MADGDATNDSNNLQKADEKKSIFSGISDWEVFDVRTLLATLLIVLLCRQRV